MSGEQGWFLFWLCNFVTVVFTILHEPLHAKEKGHEEEETVRK